MTMARKLRATPERKEKIFFVGNAARPVDFRKIFRTLALPKHRFGQTHVQKEWGVFLKE
jgi:hypothetical protein